jgi:hypothetical protein
LEGPHGFLVEVIADALYDFHIRDLARFGYRKTKGYFSCHPVGAGGLRVPDHLHELLAEGVGKLGLLGYPFGRPGTVWFNVFGAAAGIQPGAQRGNEGNGNAPAEHKAEV